MTFSLGIDIGTSGVKTATLNTESEIFSTSNIKHIKQNSNMICIEETALNLSYIGK